MNIDKLDEITEINKKLEMDDTDEDKLIDRYCKLKEIEQITRAEKKGKDYKLNIRQMEFEKTKKEYDIKLAEVELKKKEKELETLDIMKKTAEKELENQRKKEKQEELREKRRRKEEERQRLKRRREEQERQTQLAELREEQEKLREKRLKEEKEKQRLETEEDNLNWERARKKAEQLCRETSKGRVAVYVVYDSREWFNSVYNAYEPFRDESYIEYGNYKICKFEAKYVKNNYNSFEFRVDGKHTYWYFYIDDQKRSTRDGNKWTIQL